jgi:hypothetical protein
LPRLLTAGLPVMYTFRKYGKRRITKHKTTADSVVLCVLVNEMKAPV